MANKVLGRDLGDLLSRAQPARLLDRAAAKAHASAPSAPAPDPTTAAPARSIHGGETPAVEPGTESSPGVLRPPPPPSSGFAMTSGSFAFFVFDLLFLGLAVLLSQSGRFSAAAGIGLAVMSVLFGAVCGSLGVLLMAAAGSRGDENKPGSKIRVQLKR